MAAAVAALGEEEAAAFTADSAENAESGGVDVGALLKIVSGGLSLALSISDLIRGERLGKQDTEDAKRERYRAGIVYSDESRDALNRQGVIPAYYSKSNIKRLFSRNKLPYGWSEETAVKQGFAKDIRAGEFRKQSAIESERLSQKFESEREVKKQLLGLSNLQKRLRLNKTLEFLNRSIQ
jgi:hypothetical protein